MDARMAAVNKRILFGIMVLSNDGVLAQFVMLDRELNSIIVCNVSDGWLLRMSAVYNQYSYSDKKRIISTHELSLPLCHPHWSTLLIQTLMVGPGPCVSKPDVLNEMQRGLLGAVICYAVSKEF